MEPNAPLGLSKHPFAAERDAGLPVPPPLICASDQVLELADAGVPLVFLSGPAGTGRSSVVALVASEAERRGLSVARVARGDLAHCAIGGRSDLLLIDEAESIIDATLALLAPGRPERAASTIVLAAVTPFPYRPGVGRDWATVELKRLDAVASRAFLVDRAVAAGRPDLIDEAALDLLVSSARGVPRRLRILASAALFHAALDGDDRIVAAHVRQALKMQPEAALLARLGGEVGPPVSATAVPVGDVAPVSTPSVRSKRDLRRGGGIRMPVALAASVALAALLGPWFVGTRDVMSPSAASEGRGGATVPLLGAIGSPAMAATAPASQALAEALALANGWTSAPPLLARSAPPVMIAMGAGSVQRPIQTRTALVATREPALDLDPIRDARLRPLVIVRAKRSSAQQVASHAQIWAFARELRLVQAELAAQRTSAYPPSPAASPPPMKQEDNETTSSEVPRVQLAALSGPTVVRVAPTPVVAPLRVIEAAPERDAAQQARGTAAAVTGAIDRRATFSSAVEVRPLVTQARDVKEAGQGSRAVRDAADTVRTVIQQSRSAKETVEQVRAVKHVSDQAKTARDSASQARAAKEAADTAKAARDAADAAKSAKDSAEAAKLAKEAADTAKAAKEAADAVKAAKDAAESAKAAKEVAEAAKAAKYATESAKAVKDAADAAKVAKDAADAAKAAKDATDAAKVAKDAADAAKAAKDAADAAKAAKDAADSAKAAKEAADAAKAAKDAVEQVKAVKNAKDVVKDVKDLKDVVGKGN